MNKQEFLQTIAKLLKVKPEQIYCIMELNDVNQDVFVVTLIFGESVYTIDRDSKQVKEYLAYESDGAYFLNNGDIIYENKPFDNEPLIEDED